MAQSWDGWVLYTASNGHKYHYNHLTHESRWALDQRAEDHKAEVPTTQIIELHLSNAFTACCFLERTEKSIGSLLKNC